ncbi:hypothetical protein [Streptomyces sp. YIM 130001]|uniref:hypothetical protein n=1 Tax=Streptomyces sp. YIM 130001 TaxID=2259644 RepID=UPI000E645E12|nr:hypothetical protein [Streptomyces sp. YIM 130001]
MCFYAMTSYKLHHACTSCRVSFKRHAPGQGVHHPCPNCGRPLVCAGHDFAPPPRRDVHAWSVVAAVLGEGLRYEGRSGCGCGREPEYRPRTRAELRARRLAAERDGLPLSETLIRPDASTTDGSSSGRRQSLS